MADVLILTAPKEESPKMRGMAMSSMRTPAVYELRVQNIEIFNNAVDLLKALEGKEKYPTLRLSLFDDVSFDVKISSIKTNSLGVFSVKGNLVNDKNSYVVLTVPSNGVLLAKIIDASKNYEYKITCDVLTSMQKVVENDIAKMPNLPCGALERK